MCDFLGLYFLIFFKPGNPWISAFGVGWAGILLREFTQVLFRHILKQLYRDVAYME